MNLRVCLSFAVIAFMAGILDGGEEDRVRTFLKFYCETNEVTRRKSVKKVVEDCRNEYLKRTNTDESQENITMDDCFLACKLEKLNFAAKGRIDLPAINAAINRDFPETYRGRIKAVIRNCSFVVTVKLNKTQDCKPYAMFAKCQTDFLMDICRNRNCDPY